MSDTAAAADPIPNRRRYDVYLSFCDEDARSFVLSIYNALTTETDQQIVVFWDDEWFGSDDRTSKPSESTINVIGECKIAVIIFSKNYTNSKWCLQELEKITECCLTRDGLIVLPFFYDGVYPSDCRLRGDMYGKCFHDFVDRIETSEEDEDKFLSWVATISKATTYSGQTKAVNVFIYRSEHDYIDNVIVERVVTRVLNNKRDFFGAIYTMSVKSNVQNVIQLLKQSKSPLLLGIWGIAGIGKSTIAQAIYDQIGPYFVHKSFVNVAEVRGENNAEILLQGDLLYDISKATRVKIDTIEFGKRTLKLRLRRKRVLLILDNVDKLEQLDALCGSREWFDEGSKIIITTTNRHLLKEHGVDHIYRVKELDESESHELFCWGAFSQATTPQEDFGEISSQLVAYCGGLPLALKAIRTFLLGKRFSKIFKDFKDFPFRFHDFSKF